MTGHTKEGYGLAWNPCQQGLLVSGSDDNVVCLWDIEKETMLEGKQVKPIRTFTEHTNVVEDVAWHKSDVNILGSVGDDRKLLICDKRQ